MRLSVIEKKEAGVLFTKRTLATIVDEDSIDPRRMTIHELEIALKNKNKPIGEINALDLDNSKITKRKELYRKVLLAKISGKDIPYSQIIESTKSAKAHLFGDGKSKLTIKDF